MRSIIFGLALLAAKSAASLQQPLFASSSQEAEPNEYYQFDWPIQRVAIIGAGPSGLVVFRELSEAGLDVRVFERDGVPGGNWHYTEEIPLDTPVPHAPAVIGDFVPSLPPPGVDLPYSEEFEDDGEVERIHRAPKPLWESLVANLPSPLQQLPGWPLPAATPWELSHYQIRNYVRSYASYLNINSNDKNPAMAYNTRVERVEKRINDVGQEQGWRLWLKSLETIGPYKYRTTWWTEDFDAVVVASGKYNAPSIPSILGLQDWVQRFPDRLRHSRQYRRPEAYANQTVLIIGASISGSELAKDLNIQAQKVYVSFRTNSESLNFTMGNPRNRIPKNTTMIGEIRRFLPIPDGSPIQSGLVELKNGTIISGIDSVILATGFRYTFPFLPQYYDDATFAPREGAAAIVSPFLPADGSHIRDLYLDQFYLEDPTLAFLSIGTAIQTFTSIDYTALALAKVWTNTAKLPSRQKMRALYEKMVKERGGYGKRLLRLGYPRFVAQVRYLIGWLNESAAKYGGKQVDALPKHTNEVTHFWQIARFGQPPEASVSKEDDKVVSSLGLGWTDGSHEYDFLCDDDW